MSQDHASSYTATYNSRDHVAVLTQMWGSKWPEVSNVKLLVCANSGKSAG